ncbi:MAG: SUMF1/EgtB/PvdO family nonheme iron enzyme [Spirochaetales bacterium]|nr:SUMF1/EgtB/PvdO family nonheme iron enzyme [Spirochaetales bacterium]
MQPTKPRPRITYAVCLCLAALVLASCATLTPREVKQEADRYYGVGSAATRDEAEAAARRDLIANALTETARSRGSAAGRIQVDPEVADAFELPRLRTVAREEDQAGGRETVMLSVEAAKFDAYEQERQAALRAELRERLAALEQGPPQPLADRMREAGGLLERLAREGVAELLTEQDEGGRLMSTAIEAFCRQLCAELSITPSPAGGFVGPETRFEASVRGAYGLPTGSLPLRVEWHPAGRAGAEPSPQPVSLRVTTGADGRLSLAYPAGDAFRNTGVRLRVSTDFARWGESARSEVLAEIDAASAVEAAFRHFDDAQAFFSDEVLVPGGPFTAGAVPQDRRATRKEAPRQVETAAFYIDVYPVTNALYGMYLEDTGAEAFPEYWENPRFNRPDQPVVGVPFAEAVRFAAWLSGELGVVKRLPTEEEWEKAARGGVAVIYPWGDESPSDGPRANFTGNGRFFYETSPVGSYESGRNAYGLYDMAGNVWEWTSSQAQDGSRIVKGGSWMDGPGDLRISNRRELDPVKGYADVGFRLIREVTNE